MQMPAAPSPEEIEVIIKAAQEAPLANMREAAKLSATLQRFQQWYLAVTRPPIQLPLEGGPTLDGAAQT